MENDQTVPQVPTPPVTTPQPVVPPQPPAPSRKIKKIIILLLAVAIVAGGVIGVYVAVFQGKMSLPVATQPTATPIPTQIKTPVVQEIKLNIQNGQEVKNKELNAAFKYTSRSVIEDCFDCVKSGVVEVIKDGVRKEAIFSCGGVAGDCIERATIFNMSIHVDTRNTEEISLTIKYPSQ